MREVYRSALLFITLNILVMGLKIAFPSIVQWLPAHMK
jgi:TRAP-type mannitol/chloroaromatic compound transport system permease large subunit